MFYWFYWIVIFKCSLIIISYYYCICASVYVEVCAMKLIFSIMNIYNVQLLQIIFSLLMDLYLLFDLYNGFKKGSLFFSNQQSKKPKT